MLTTLFLQVVFPTQLIAAPTKKPLVDLPTKILTRNEIENELTKKSQNTKKKKTRHTRYQLRNLNSFGKSELKIAPSDQTPMIFDLPVTYNQRVRKWISYFQGSGKVWFKRWLERSHRHIPPIRKILIKEKLPTDLVYVSMIESGFSTRAVSSASAVGPWQFIRSTGLQYGLRANWWLDERRDFNKSTHSAAKYFKYLYKMFNSWYLSAAAYNMGENRLKRLIRRYKTRDYWDLSMKPRFAKETQDYVPKLMAAILISKAPSLYGFRDLKNHQPLKYETVELPGGTDLVNLADQLGVTRKYIKDLNPELLKGFVPRFVKSHAIRVPQGAGQTALRLGKNKRIPHLRNTAKLRRPVKVK